MVSLLSRFRRTLALRLDEWIYDSALEMHRRAHYERRAGEKWEESADDMVASPDTEKLGELSHFSEITLADVKKGGSAQTKELIDR